MSKHGCKNSLKSFGQQKAFASPTASDGPSGTVTPSDGISEASSDAGSNASSPAFPTRNVA